MSDTNIRTGQCHCGAVRFEATLSDGFNAILRGTCSYCRMRGAVVVMAQMGGIKFLKGEDALTVAWAGVAPATAVGPDGSAQALPDAGAKRDASGSPLDAVIGSIGTAL